MKRLITYIVLSFLTLAAFAQKVPVSGVVKDAETGEGVIGASVLIKGTTTGTIADIDGNFTIDAPAGAEIVVGAISYADYSFTVSPGMAPLTILLQPSAEFLEDVVVVGYGSVKKENLSGAVDQVSSEVFEGRPVNSATQMLVGSIPNLNITLADGKPGRTASYNVRGATSIGGGGSALILIDGVEGDPSLINPNDIESVSVLKDAASASIYGSRATYGVVLITTKNPDKNKETFSITYSGNASFMQPTAVPDVVDDGYVYARLFYDAWYNYNRSQPTGINKSQPFSRIWLDEFRQRKKNGIRQSTTVDESGQYVYYGNTDYYDVIYKDYVFANTHNVSASGTNGPLSYIFSGVKTLQLLRQPMEDGFVTITRVNAQSTYPSRFVLVCSMNPCPCGNLGSRTKQCRCTPNEIRRYLNRISGPLLDRIDMHIEVESIPAENLSDTALSESSDSIRKRVEAARQVQLERYKTIGIHANAELNARTLARACNMTREAQALLLASTERLKLSNRAYTRILKVARTIADLDGFNEIEEAQIAEAVQYRTLDRKYWG